MNWRFYLIPLSIHKIPQALYPRKKGAMVTEDKELSVICVFSTDAVNQGRKAKN